MNLKIKQVRQTARIPEFKTTGAAGMDCYASLEGIEEGLREFIIMPGKFVKIPLGIAIELEPGYEAEVKNRSGITMDGIIVYPGTIDSDYRGEVSAMVHNATSRAYVITNITRIAQMVIRKIECPDNGLTMELVDELSETERGESGFGHTGK